MIRHRPEVDGLRAAAIAFVVLFHAWGSTFPGGYIGVDIFFVISGYLITSIILTEGSEGRFCWLNFYARRARRILPALLIVTAFTTITAFIVLLPRDLIEYGKTIIYTLLFGANFRFQSTPGYFDHTMLEDPLLHMWSLSVEEQFYLLWPVLLILMLRLLQKRHTTLITVAVAAISLIVAEVLVHVWPRSAFFHLPARGWELLAGAAVAMGVAPRVTGRKLAEFLSASGLALMIVPVFLYTEDTLFPGVTALAPVLGCALVIHANEATATSVAKVLSSGPIVFIGLISYSLYLWHWPLFAFATYTLNRPLTPLEALFGVLAATAIAAASYRFVEQPFRKKRPALPCLLWNLRWFSIPLLSRTAFVAVGLTAVMIAAGSFFQKSQGAPWRLPPDVRLLTEKKDPWTWEDTCVEKTSNRKGMLECQFGDRSTHLIVWGDSHAAHYMPLILKIYSRGRAFLRPGCVPVMEARLVSGAGREIYEGCKDDNDYVMDRILALRPKIVIMASRWTQTEQLPYGRERRLNGYLIEASSPLTREGSRQTFTGALDRTLKILTGAGIKVVIMGQVPEMEADPNYCLALSKLLGMADCGTEPRQDVERRQYYVNKSLAAVSLNPNVFVFHPFESLCDEVQCYSIRKGKSLYYDNDHLSADGAISMLQAFDSLLPEEFRVPFGITATIASASAPPAALEKDITQQRSIAAR